MVIIFEKNVSILVSESLVGFIYPVFLLASPLISLSNWIIFLNP
jgi:hypothetical protein